MSTPDPEEPVPPQPDPPTKPEELADILSTQWEILKVVREKIAAMEEDVGKIKAHFKQVLHVDL